VAQRKSLWGLQMRGGTWHIDKRIRGRRVCESTGTSDRQEAEEILAKRISEIREADIFGVRPKRTFRQAATKYLNEANKASLWIDAMYLEMLEPFIGDLPLESIHMGTLQPFIKARKAKGVKNRTVNYGIQTVRHILNLAAGEWIDENGRTWLAHAPKIKFLPETDKRAPYPLSWDEQVRLFNELPAYLTKMALFAVNTGCREGEVCRLQWEWEVEIPEMKTGVFIIPGESVKNRQDRLVVLNRVAKAVVEEMRGKHPTHVFTYKGKPLKKMYGRAWRDAREKAKLEPVRVHDLKHTYGRRLRAAGVSFEDRQDLLGHKSSRVTTHYSMPELESLIAASNEVCGKNSRKTHAIVVLKQKIHHADSA